MNALIWGRPGSADSRHRISGRSHPLHGSGVPGRSVSLGVQAHHQENLWPALSEVMILGSLRAMAAGRRKNS